MQRPQPKIPHYYLAILLGLLLHTTLSVFTFESTYDAFVHMFFADHYARNWFDVWEYRWYTGFTVTSYPPLVHQGIALLSKVFGLQGGFIIWGGMVMVLLIRGVYAFSRIWVSETAALYAAFLAVFSTSIAEALHIFGQLPSLTGSALLLNACPQIYKWLRYDQKARLFLSWLFIGVISSAHHVTTIFGMVFFVMPVLGLAVYDRAFDSTGPNEKVSIKDFMKEAVRQLPRIIAFGSVVIVLTLIVIFPYWYWSKSDPISQIPIPHGSRDSFFENASSGLVFFLIPWGMMLFFFPFLWAKLFRKRNLFLGLSALVMFVLGSGGTTPIPRAMLGDAAFDILTLDRFTYWATLVSLPFWGLFFEEVFSGGWRAFLEKRFHPHIHKLSVVLLGGGVLLSFVMTVHIGFFRNLQPERIDIDPITNFLEKDQHERWRYMTLGFGDQMAWLSANTRALSVDGNYHSARRLPEMTTRAVERLENAKYQRDQGLGTLRQFLSHPEKYHLKFIFSNDRFYDPLLYNTGWRYLQRLENGIFVWEKPDIPVLPAVLPRKDIPDVQRFMWGTLPLLLLCLLLLYAGWLKTFGKFDKRFPKNVEASGMETAEKKYLWSIQGAWAVGLLLFSTGVLIYGSIKHNEHANPENALLAYYSHLDFKRFGEAYECLSPDSGESMEQFLLKHSLKGGLLSSYSKLDSLAVSAKISGDNARARVAAHWTTSLMQYETEHIHTLEKKNGKWFLLPDAGDLFEPPSTFTSEASINYLRQGRRNADPKGTRKRDILDRPQVEVSQVRLVRKENALHLIGALINTDADPAHLNLSASLFDINGREILKANASDIIQYRLLPQESTPFRIDFEEAARNKGEKLEDLEAAAFVLFVQTQVCDEDFYRSVAIRFPSLPDKSRTMAEVYNYGTEQIIIPKVITSHYSSDSLVWVDRDYLPYAVRPERKQVFELVQGLPDPIKTVKIGEDGSVVVNGKLQLMPPLYPTTGNTEPLETDYHIHSLTRSSYEEE